MLELFNNKEAFLRIKPKRLIIFYLIMIVLFGVASYYMINTKVYETYQTKGYSICDNECLVVVLIPNNLTFDKISLNNKFINYEIISQELKLNEELMTTFFELKLKIPQKLTNKEIITLNFYYQQERLIKKIKDKMF